MSTPIRTLLLIGTLCAISIFQLSAQSPDLSHVKSALEKLNEGEIEAFKNGDCNQLSEYIDDDVSIFLNGRKGSKKKLIGFCRMVERPFEKPSHVDMEYIPISAESGYVLRTMEFSKDGVMYKNELVTKLWMKKESGWKIVHIHTTISTP